MNSPCALCHRVTKTGTTKHHLIPRTCHSNKWFKKQFSREEMLVTIDLCRDCHKALHRLVPDEKEIGRTYNTVARLKDHPKVAKYLAWARKQR